MVHPISVTYLDIQQARASAVLPAAPVWDPTPIEMFCSSFENVVLSLSYTRGGAAGAFDIQIEMSPYSVAANMPAGAEEWVSESAYAGGILAAGVDTQSRFQREYQTYQATGAAAEAFVYGPISLAGAVERLRVSARESGNVWAPCTLQIQAQFA